MIKKWILTAEAQRSLSSLLQTLCAFAVKLRGFQSGAGTFPVEGEALNPF
jgi:hypothetical protein